MAEDPSFGTPPGTFDAEAYASWFETSLGRRVWADERAALLPLLGPVAGLRVLDAGAGEGRLARELASDGAKVTGVDQDPSMLRLARSRGKGGGTFLSLAAGRVDALPFPDGTFDVVVAVTVLCFVADPATTVRELVRVVKPGGRIVLGELGTRSVWALGRRIRGALGHTVWRRARFWTPAALDGLLGGAGALPSGRASAVFYPPSALLARALKPLDRLLSRRGTVWGAAFLVSGGVKPLPTADPRVPHDGVTR